MGKEVAFKLGQYEGGTWTTFRLESNGYTAIVSIQLDLQGLRDGIKIKLLSLSTEEERKQFQTGAEYTFDGNPQLVCFDPSRFNDRICAKSNPILMENSFYQQRVITVWININCCDDIRCISMNIYENPIIE